MTRLFSCGFELNSADKEFNSDINGTLHVETTNARTGTYALRIDNLVSAAQKRVSHQFASANSNGPFWVRFYFRLQTAPTADNQIFNFRNSSGTRIVFIVLNSSSALELWDEDGQIGSDSSALSTSTWYRIEVKFDSSGAGATDIVEAKIDGTDFATSSTRDLSSGVFSISLGGNLNAEAQTQADWHFDDVAINNNSGSFQNTYPGAGGIIHLLPDGAGDATDWTGAYTDVDEVTPDDATTFISSGTLDQVEEVTLGATPAAIGSGDTINWVGVFTRHNVSNATGSDPAYVQRLKASPGGTTDEGGVISTTSTSWTNNAGGQPRNYHDFPNSSNYEQPGGSSAWTKAALDTAQIGVRISTGDTHLSQVTSLQLVIDFTPASGTAYNQSVSGGITPSGTLTKQDNKALSGSISSIVGTISKLTSKSYSGSITPSGDVSKQTNKILSGAISSIAGVLETVRLFFISLSGDITPSGTIEKQTQKSLSGNITSIVGAIIRNTNKALSGSIVSAGEISKQINKVLSGAVSSIVGALDIIRLFVISLSGDLTLSGTVNKSTSKSLSGVLSSIAGTIAKQTNKLLAGGNTPAGNIAKETSKLLSGSATSSGDISKQTNKDLLGSITPLGSIAKLISKFLSGAISSIVGSISSVFTSGGGEDLPVVGQGEKVKSTPRETYGSSKRKDTKSGKRENIE